MKVVAGPESCFFSLSEKNVKEYHSRTVADLHALVAAPLSYYACFHVCDDPDKNIFNNQECLMTPHRMQLYLIALSTAYVTYDIILCIFELNYSFTQGADFIVHHILGILGAAAVMVSGRFNVALSAGNLMSEWTGFAMNHRWRMLKHKQSDGVGFIVVNAIFFFSYLFVRVIFMGMLILRNYQIQHSFDIFSDPPLVSVAAVVSTALQIGLYVIQLYWFYLIFGAFLNTLQGGKPEIKSKDVFVEDSKKKDTKAQ